LKVFLKYIEITPQGEDNFYIYIMIEIIKLEEKMFGDDLTKESIKSFAFGNLLFVTDIHLISELLTVDIPIKNRRIFLKNVLSFLRYLENRDIENEREQLLSRSVFIKFFGTDHYYSYKKILKDLKVLTNVPYKDGTWYDKDKKIVKKYRIHDQYFEEKELCLVILEEPRKKYVREFTCDKDVDVTDRFKNTIENIEINTKNAIEAELNDYLKKGSSSHRLRSRISKIFYLKSRRFIKKGNKVDRIYHSFTNLSKIARKHLSVNFNYVDITNCQPLLLVAYLKENEFDYDQSYKYVCESGIFYEEFNLVKEEDDRQDIKVGLYKNVYFGFNKQSLYNKKFKELFPTTWDSLDKIYKTDISLASRLQNIEAKLFNNLVPKKSKYYFTLFDSIYFSDIEDCGQIYKEIEKYFTKLGIKTQVNIG
jgi:hypothetical protein